MIRAVYYPLNGLLANTDIHYSRAMECQTPDDSSKELLSNFCTDCFCTITAKDNKDLMNNVCDNQDKAHVTSHTHLILVTNHTTANLY